MITLAPDDWYIERRDGISKEPKRERVRFILAIGGQDPTGKAGVMLVPVILANGQLQGVMGAPIIEGQKAGNNDN